MGVCEEPDNRRCAAENERIKVIHEEHGRMKREGQFKCLKHWLSESFVEVWIRVKDNKAIIAALAFKGKKKNKKRTLHSVSLV